MSKRLLILFITVCYLSLVQSFCIKPDSENVTYTTYYCAKTENYISEINKLPTPTTTLVLMFAHSDIPVLANHGFDKFSAMLTHLMVRNSGLKTIEDDAFKGLTKMQVLKLRNNELQEVKPIWFQDMTNLKSLDLTANRISEFNPSVMKNLPNLQELNLMLNRLTCVDVKALQNLDPNKVQMFYLSFDWICQAHMLDWDNTLQQGLSNDVGRIFEILENCYQIAQKAENELEQVKILDQCMKEKLEEALLHPEMLKKKEEN